MEIRQLNDTDPFFLFQQIARIHIQEIHFGILPLFGEEFLARLNVEMTRAPFSGVWAAIERGQVVGFVSGCGDLRELYRFFFLHSFFPLLKYLGTAIFSTEFLRKVPSICIYPFEKSDWREDGNVDDAESRAELLAIAVSPSMQGRGLGKQLVDALEKGLKKWNLASSYHVATNILEIGSNTFYRTQGFKPVGTKKHHDLTLQVYEKQI
jgi:ribosomal protein S18 acetylase RimI-like enzyme